MEKVAGFNVFIRSRYNFTWPLVLNAEAKSHMREAA